MHVLEVTGRQDTCTQNWVMPGHPGSRYKGSRLKGWLKEACELLTSPEKFWGKSQSRQQMFKPKVKCQNSNRFKNSSHLQQPQSNPIFKINYKQCLQGLADFPGSIMKSFFANKEWKWAQGRENRESDTPRHTHTHRWSTQKCRKKKQIRGREQGNLTVAYSCLSNFIFHTNNKLNIFR